MKFYRVGGVVRDTLLGLPPKDVDYVVVGGTHEEMMAQGFTKVGAAFPVYLHPDTGEEYALARRERKVGAGYHGFDVEFSPDVTLEEDLSRRDLTINAMAMDSDGNVIDPFNGQADLEAGLLRHVSDAFAEDPIRVLRVARFAARYDFEVHPDTLELMHKIAPELSTVPTERIWAEFEKGLMEAHPANMGDVLWKCGAFSNAPILRPYQGFGYRWNNLKDTDTAVTRFCVLGSSFRDEDFNPYRIPIEFERVHKATKPDAILTFSAWPFVPVEERVKALVDVRAFNDDRLLNQVLDVVEVFRRNDTHPMYMPMVREAVFHALRVAKSVDTEAIAKAAPSPKQIGPMIFAARCAALDADPLCKTLSLKEDTP